jgi:hypothetical protein
MKEKPPELELEDVADVRKMSAAELKNLQGDRWKMYCGVEGCYHYTTVFDFGIGSYWAPNCGGGVWMDVMKEFFICGAHMRRYRYQLEKLPQKEGPKINNITRTINHPEFPEK